MLGGKRQGLVIALAATILGCQDLPPIPAGACGNKIIDPGEDCDGSIPTDVDLLDGEDVKCGDPGSVYACRFDCSAETVGCPLEYACGADGICRKPSGEFELIDALPASPSHVQVGDFDGDGLDDVITLDDDSGQIDVYFFESGGGVGRTFSVPSDGALPAIGHLAFEDTTDFTIAVQTGLGVMQGQPDRTFTATAFAPITVTWGDVHLVSARVIQDPKSKIVDEVMVAFHAEGGNWGAYTSKLGAAGLPDLRFKLPIGPAAGKGWAPRLPVADFAVNSNTSPCDEILLVPVGGTAVQAVSPCAGQTWSDDGQANQHPAVTLPNGDTVKSAIAASLNPVHGSQPILGRDTHIDIVIQGEKGIYAAYGDGTGSFSTSPTVPSIPNMASPIMGLTEMPLAIADLNQDGAPDAVLPHGVLLSGSGVLPTIVLDGNQYFLAATPLDVVNPWDDAVVVDFNGDGWLDVVASSPGGTGIQIFTNAGNGTFNPDLIATEQHASLLTLGDFDGDLTPDVAFRQGGDTGEASVWVAYGQKGQPLSTPISLGVLPGVDQLVSGVGLIEVDVATSISDLAVLNHAAGGDKVAAFFGRGDRLLQSPFLFFDPTDGTRGKQVDASAIGRFHKGGEDHADTAVIVSYDNSPACGGRPEARLWLLLGTGLAEVSKSVVSGSLCAGGLGSVVWPSAVMTPLDVDGDGQDELIIVAPNKGMGETDAGALFVARADADGKFDLGEMITLPERFYDRSVGIGPVGKALRRNAPLCTADVDGDGVSDIVLLSVNNEMDSETSRVAVLWGTGDAKKPFSGSDIGHVALDSMDPKEVMSAVTCTDGDGDSAADLLVLTNKTAYLAYGAADRELHGLRLDDEHDETGFITGGLSVASGNIDDDGIPDIAISGPSGILVYAGKATNP